MIWNLGGTTIFRKHPSGHQGATKSKAFYRGTVQGIAQLRGHGPKCPESYRPIASWKMDERLVGVGRSTPAHYKYNIYIYKGNIFIY